MKLIKSAWLIILVVLFAGVVVLPACSAVDIQESTPALAPAPDFELKDLSGQVTSLSGLRGKVVVLSFWLST